MRALRIDLALTQGIFSLPDTGSIAVYRPVMTDDLGALPKERLVVLTSFFPDHQHFAALGFATAPAAPYAAALVCLPRAREQARALLAQAAAEVAPGGLIAIDGQKTDGIEAVLKELRGRVTLSEILSKAHGKIASFRAGPELADWAARATEVADGFITLPGVFSADGPDRGSVMLAAALPAKLGSKVVDLGAGWGYLSRAILARDGVKRLDLVEAEAVSLDCAKRNIQDERAQFHWTNALTFRPESLVNAVVMNPPFHLGRAAEPGVGAAFIGAAKRMLAPDGALWMVANKHLPYDEVLSEAFLEHETVAADNAFRVIRAIKPRRLIKPR